MDEFVLMPNHIHGIIIINESPIGVQNIEPLPTNQYQHIISGSIGSIIRGFKLGVTKWSRIHTDRQIVWQRNYYEHIIRNEEDYFMIREYIRTNPQNWEKDEMYDYPR